MFRKAWPGPVTLTVMCVIMAAMLMVLAALVFPLDGFELNGMGYGPPGLMRGSGDNGAVESTVAFSGEKLGTGSGAAFLGDWQQDLVPGVHGTAQRVILILINGLSMEDVRDHPYWKTLAEKSYLAGMTIKTARGHGDVHQAVTLGAGTLAAGSKDVHGYDADERVEAAGGTAADWYRQWTGRSRHEGVLVPEIGLLVRENEKSDHFPAVPGGLGQRIRESGGLTAVFGNSDRGDRPKRLAPLITMDEQGWTPVGEVGPGMVRPAPERPFGVVTHYERMLAEFRRLPQNVRLAVFELGDLDRLAAVWDMMDPRYARPLRLRILNEMAGFVETMARSLHAGDSLWVVSLMVDEESYQKGMWLSPILWFPKALSPGLNSSVNASAGRGFLASESTSGGGLLVSDSTRWPGIVANVDVAATILAQLGVSRPVEMGGTPMRVAATAGRQAKVGQDIGDYWRELAHIQWAHRLRPQVLRPYVISQICLFLLAALVWGLRFKRWYRPVRLLLSSMLFAPTILLIVSSPRLAAWHVLLFIWAGSLLLAWLTERVSIRFALLAASVGVWLGVVVDLVRGGVWLKRSLLSYDPMLAARFYGIGNEYMGIVIGAVILTAALVWEWMEQLRERGKGRWLRRILAQLIRWVVPLGMLLWILVMASPADGANAGGAVAAGVGFVSAWIFLRFPHMTPGRLVVGCLGGLALALFCLAVLNGLLAGDYESGGGVSHVGKALRSAGDGEWEMLRAMAARKLQTNWRLIRHSIWTKVFAAALIVWFVVQFLPGKGRSMNRLHPAWTAAIRGILAASVAALVFNDSGIVAAATAIVYLVVPILVLE